MADTTKQDNKIEYGLSNVYYSVITGYDVETQKYTYAAPVPIPGAVSVSFSASGDSNPFYADNIVYHNTKTNAGYEGDLEIARIPDSFCIDVLGEKEVDGMLVENSDAQGKEFALMFQFEGDVSGKRHIMYRCSAGRPDISSSTKEESTTPNTNKLTITCMARENDHNIKSALLESKNPTRYKNWFTQVQEPVKEDAA
ncbi:MAG: phage tail protein [Ruminococcus sp.]|nr:phage tail protein [Ruminococcus sp.]